MNKQKLRITGGDVKRCDQAVKAVKNLAGLRGCMKYKSARTYSENLIDHLERLKLVYASLVGTIITDETKLTPAYDWRELVGEVNQLYVFGYPSPHVQEWRDEALKPFTLTMERLEWIKQQKTQL